MGSFGIGAAVRRKEDLRFLTGKGRYTDDINRPGQLQAFLLRSPHAHAEIAAHRHGQRQGGAGRRGDLHRRRSAGTWAACRAAGSSPRRTARRWSSRRVRCSPRARCAMSATPWRWSSPRRAQQAQAAAELIDDRLQGIAGGGRQRRGDQAGQAAAVRHGPGQSLLRLASGRQGRGRRRFRPRPPRDAPRPRQQPAGLQPDGAARRHRRV